LGEQQSAERRQAVRAADEAIRAKVREEDETYER